MTGASEDRRDDQGREDSSGNQAALPEARTGRGSAPAARSGRRRRAAARAAVVPTADLNRLGAGEVNKTKMWNEGSGSKGWGGKGGTQGFTRDSRPLLLLFALCLLPPPPSLCPSAPSHVP